MEINKRFFPKILLDNEVLYFSNLIGVIESVDELASLEITKSPYSYNFRLAPSLPKYSEMLLQEILKLHTFFGIRLDLSKSIKTSGTITYAISLDN